VIATPSQTPTRAVTAVPRRRENDGAVMPIALYHNWSHAS
jgi:hypothetical protein